MKRVAVALIFNKQNKILIGRRAKTEPLAGFWEFPGGKIESGETPQEALKRELKEELNVESEINEHFIDYTYPNGKFKLMTYYTKIDESTIEKRVHDDLRWVSVADALKVDNMFESNVIILNQLLKMIS